ncbi:MAG: hypothetical protein V9G04_17990 [Nocardioides sp.]|jgi:hypothetical protein
MNPAASRRTSVGWVASLTIWLLLLLGAANLSDAVQRHPWAFLVLSMVGAGAGALLAGTLVRAPGRPASVRSLARAEVTQSAQVPIAARPPRVDRQPAPSPYEPQPEARGAWRFTVAKEGSAPDENDDAAAIDRAGRWAAVSDGASSSFRAGEWSRHLCDSFVAAPPPADNTAVEAWLGRVVASFPEAENVEGWWGDSANGLESHATFVGVTLMESESGPRWRAVAVGDSIVVHLRPGVGALELLTSFPIAASGGFEFAPELLRSGAQDPPPLRSIEGRMRSGDCWLLMSDELGHWALAAHEAGAPVWQLLLSRDGAAITERIGEARRAGTIQNDDMTLVVLWAPTPPPPAGDGETTVIRPLPIG